VDVSGYVLRVHVTGCEGNYNVTINCGVTMILFDACRAGKLEEVKRLIDDGANINEQANVSPKHVFFSPGTFVSAGFA
jgi:hypothetical protein